jgi:fucose 4-O-acetylase-like acetyltransferase
MTTLRSREVERLDKAALRADPEPGPRRRAGRDPWFDTMKMTLVTLVVVGHSWTLLPQTTSVSWAYDFLYAWHIPAFVIVTGYLSRRFTWSPADLLRLVRTVAVPYVIFEAALAWFRYQVGGVELKDLFTDPHWPMWYLSALFFWRLMTPVFMRMPRAHAVGIAVVISLLAGLKAGDTLDAARIFGLLPFFVLGLRMGEGGWRRLRRPNLAPWAIGGLVTVLVLTRFTDSWIETEWYYYRSRYDVLEPNDLRAAAIRLILLGVGLLGACSFFVLVPKVRNWFGNLGPATLVVYLFHGFVVLGALYAGYPDWTAQHALLAFVVTTLTAVGLTLILAAPPVARVLKVAVDPLGWLEGRRQALLAPSSDARLS